MTDERTETFPVSSGQERLLLLDRTDPSGLQYAVVEAALIGPGLEPDHLERCIRALVARHDALRVTFSWERERPVQRVHEALEPEISRHARVAGQELPALVDELVRRPFDLEHGPLFRVLIAELEDGRCALMFSAHHAVVDGLSMDIIFRELAILYEDGELQAAPAVSYPDWASWQREQQDGPAGEAGIEHWRSVLRGAPELLALPWDRRRPDTQSSSGETIEVLIPQDLVERVVALARRQRVTPFAVYQSVFAVLLSRLSSQEDVVLAFPASGREHSELDAVVGFFVNTVPLRVSIPSGVSFATLLRETAAATIDAVAHQDVPLERIVSSVAPRRDPAWHPLFQVLISWDGSAGIQRLGGLDVSRFPIRLPIAKFDLSLVLSPIEGGVNAAFEFRTDLLDASTVTRWADHLVVLLSALVEYPDVPVAQAPLMSAAETARVTRYGMGPAVTIPRLALPELWDRSVAQWPDRPAVIHGDDVWSYAEMDARSVRLAGQLQKVGVGPASRVGIRMTRSLDMFAAVLAVLKTGAAYVPLDPSYPPARLDQMSSDAGVLLEIDNISNDDEGFFNPPTVLSDSLAYVIYTSGSTGEPKGVCVRHSSVTNLALAQGDILDIGPQDRVAQFASLSFDVSVAEMWITWARGAALVLIDTDRRIGPALAQLLRRQRVSVLVASPTALGTLDPADHPELRVVVTTGEACPPWLVDRWGAGRRLVNAYGPTETTVWATAAELAPGEQVTIGAAMPNTSVRLVDRCGALVPLGVVGELWIGGSGVAAGYLNRPELTGERFGSGQYRTGDLGLMRADGSIVLVGRADDQVKLHGYRIELGEVESVLMSHPAVAAAVADIRSDGESRRLVGYIVTRDGQLPPRLRAWMAALVPKHLVPSVFCVIPAVPLSPAGKVDRAALPEPGGQRREITTGFAAPRTALEEQLSVVWATQLGLERVGVHDNFFDLGGDSLGLMRVYQALQDLDELPMLDITDLFKYPTVASLARGLTDDPGDRSFVGNDRRRSVLARRRGRRP